MSKKELEDIQVNMCNLINELRELYYEEKGKDYDALNMILKEEIRILGELDLELEKLIRRKESIRKMMER